MTATYYQDDAVTLYHGDSLDVLRSMPDQSVDCCVTSPPYFGLRDYGVEGQMGAESSPTEYVEGMRALFAEVRRVLSDDGTLWLNLGDSYKGGGGGLPPKNLIGIPWRAAFALQDDGWILRNSIIWHKPNAMPESVTDRLSTRHENVFMFSKSRRYWFDLDPIRVPLLHPDAGFVERNTTYTAEMKARRSEVRGAKADIGRNPGDVWSIPTQPFPGAHFAVYPLALPERCILAGCKPGGTVLDPFSGSGTTGLAAAKHGRRYVGIDLNREYLDLSMRTRLAQPSLNLTNPYRQKEEDA